MNNPRSNAPPEGAECRLKGSDYMGDYYINGIRKNYKQKPNVYAFKDGHIYWRFVDSVGEKIQCHDVESWELITHTVKG